MDVPFILAADIVNALPAVDLKHAKVMVEAVAKAIFELDVEDNDGYGEYTKEDIWDKVAGQDQNHYRRMSRAAIKTMRGFLKSWERKDV
jgi:hypothetical protein